MKKTVLVVAGNYREFEDWRRSSRVDGGVYVRGVETLYGHHPESVDLVLWGTWNEKRDVVEYLWENGFLKGLQG